MEKKDQRTAMRVSWASIAVNLILAAFKLFAGLFACSAAMVSDAVHSASDVFSTLIVMIGIKASSRGADRKHPYGHDRFECVAAILLAAVLAGTGIVIGVAGVQKLASGAPLVVPGLLALVAALVSVAVKEAMYWYTRAAAIKINSGALKADAWHHRSDALSSVGSFVGILGAQLGVPVLDTVASLLIAALIVKAAASVFIDAVRKMTDESCGERAEQAIKRRVEKVPGVQGVAVIKTRKFGNSAYVEVEAVADGGMTLNESDRVARRVHDAVEEGFPLVKHCAVKLTPPKEE